jgi:hypothetical protein
LRKKKHQIKILYALDLEGVIIMDRGIVTSISQDNDTSEQTRSLKIRDETGCINIIIWNEKVSPREIIK